MVDIKKDTLSILLILSGVGLLIYSLKKEKKLGDKQPVRVDLGIIPEDLPRLDVVWERISLSERLEVGRRLIAEGLSKKYIVSVITASLIEQPERTLVPNKNILGWICWGKRKYWGWVVIKDELDKLQPIGYVIIRHGGKLAVSFAFNSIYDCIKLAYYIFKKREIDNAYKYWSKWVGMGGTPPKSIVDAWNYLYDKINRSI